VEDLVGKAQPLQDAGALEAKHKEVDGIRSALAHLDPGLPYHAILSEGLVKAQDELAKLQKKAPCPPLLIEKMRTARQEQALAMAKWEQDAAKGKQKSADALSSFLQVIDAHAQQLLEKRRSVVQAHTDVTTAWEEFNARRRQQWQAILANFDKKVAEVNVAPLNVAMDIVPSPGQAAPDMHGNVNPFDELEKAKKEVRDTNEKLVALQQKMAMELQARTHEAITARFDCQPTDLPQTVPEPLPEQWIEYHRLWESLEQVREQEAATGYQYPLTFGQLQAGLAVPQVLLGPTIWQRAYPDGLTPDTIVTIQVRTLLSMSLKKQEAKLLHDKDKQIEAAAQVTNHIAEACTEYRAKRLRSDSAAPAPPTSA